MEPDPQSIAIELEELYSIYQSLPQPTFIWKYENDDFHLVGFNQAATKFASNQIDQLLNKKASDLYKNDQEVIDDLHRCLKEKAIF